MSETKHTLGLEAAARQERERYLRELRDRAAVAVLPSIVEDCQKHMGQLDETWRTGAGIEAKRIGEALVGALYPEEARAESARLRKAAGVAELVLRKGVLPDGDADVRGWARRKLADALIAGGDTRSDLRAALSPAPEVTHECDQCGEKTGADWTSWQCPGGSGGFGSCDGKMVPLSPAPEEES